MQQSFGIPTHHEERAEVHPAERGVLHLRHLEEDLQQLLLLLQRRQQRRRGRLQLSEHGLLMQVWISIGLFVCKEIKQCRTCRVQ